MRKCLRISDPAVFIICLSMVCLLSISVYGDENWRTYCEKTGFTETPRYEQTVEYCQKLAEHSKYAKFTDFGISPQGRKLPLLIVDRKREFKPIELMKRNRPVVLIEACIHPGECCGKDAGLMLMRDILVDKKYPGLMDNVVILFIPIFNVDGHERFGPYNRINQNGPAEMGFRTTARNLNLNRDFAKADAAEMRAWLKLFASWLPDFLIDLHTTDGIDFQYVITYAIANRQNMVRPVRDWLNDFYLPSLYRGMEETGFPILIYGGFRDRSDPTRGMVSWPASPRFSHGYGAVQNRPFLLVEAQMMKAYRQRVEGSYQIILNTLKLVGENPEEYLNIIREGDRLTSETLPGQKYSLSYRITDDTTRIIDFKGVETRVVDSEISGGKWLQWSDYPATYEVPLNADLEPAVTVEIPCAYIVPPQWTEPVQILGLHGIVYNRLAEDADLTVNSYIFDGVAWRERSYEGRHPLKYEVMPIVEDRHFPVGSVVIPCGQRTCRLIAHLLEPEGPDSFVRWGFFDAIFEQKEYAEDYVMEEMAREMIEEYPGLKREFEKRVEEDSSFAASPEERLDFFYRHSPYWDDNINKYPVGKIMIEHKAQLDSLKYLK
jgi:hypothetical protein